MICRRASRVAIDSAHGDIDEIRFGFAENDQLRATLPQKILSIVSDEQNVRKPPSPADQSNILRFTVAKVTKTAP